MLLHPRLRCAPRKGQCAIFVDRGALISWRPGEDGDAVLLAVFKYIKGIVYRERFHFLLLEDCTIMYLCLSNYFCNTFLMTCHNLLLNDSVQRLLLDKTLEILIEG